MPLSFPRIGIDFVLRFVKLMSLELKEGNILLNDALNTTTAPATTTVTTTSTATITTTSTIVLRLYVAEHMVNDNSDRKRGNPMPTLYGLLFPISNKGSFICTIEQT